MSFRNRSSRGGRKENDGKYLRLTGLWPSKNKDTLWTGKFRNQDLEKLIEKCDEADKAGADLVVFLWENTEKNGRKDPDFTVQISVSEDDGNGRGRSSRRGAGSDRGKDRADEDQDDNQEDNDNEEPEEKEEKSSRRGKSKSAKEEPRSRRSGASKKDKNDW